MIEHDSPSLKYLFRGAICATAALLAAGAHADVDTSPAQHVIATGAGAAAKVACSGLFVSGFTLEQITRDVERLAPPVTQGFNYEIDREKGTVVATKAGASRTALYRPGLGCTLVVETDVDTLLRQAQGMVPPRQRFRRHPWPEGDRVDTGHLPPGIDAAALSRTMDEALKDETPGGEIDTRALVVVHHGRIVAERYAPGYSSDTRFLGWSASKSVTSALIGTLVSDGKLALDAPAPVAAWRGADDPRRAITLRQLLTMSSGLAFREGRYAPGDDSAMMLFERGDMGAYAAAQPLAHQPDEVFSYSSGTTNILGRVLLDATGGSVVAGESYARHRLFDQAGMTSAVFERDESGAVVGSSYFFATARDWARFGLLHLNRGKINGRQILAPEWVDFVRAPSRAEDRYGGQFWRNDPSDDDSGSLRFADLPPDAYFALGHNTQIVGIFPSQDAVIVRLGWTTGRGRFDLNKHFAALLGSLGQ